jgi:hypothetical protein
VRDRELEVCGVACFVDDDQGSDSDVRSMSLTRSRRGNEYQIRTLEKRRRTLRLGPNLLEHH